MIKKSLAVLFAFTLILGLSFSAGAVIPITEPYPGVETPEEFNQAPRFDQAVEDGDLPPVEERLPAAEDVYVVEPNDSIGEYGGTVLSATQALTTFGEDHMLMDLYVSFVQPSPDASELTLNLAKDIEQSEDRTTYTIHLREGLKWSDGVPFTTEDIEFWWEDMHNNEEYAPWMSDSFIDADGEVMDLVIIDDYTFRVEFGTPQPYFLTTLVHEVGWLWLSAKHHLKNYHIDYVGEEEMEELLDEYGFEEWYELMAHMDEGEGQANYIEGAPTLGPYVLESMETDRRVYTANPYFWKVDTEGNQLPYFDRIETDLVADREVLNGRIMSGDIDFAAYETDIRNYPMFRQNEEAGSYTTMQWTSGFSSDVIYMFNHTHEDENMREIFQNKKFKQAMSLAIDRDEMNEIIYFGQAEPAQYTLLPSSQYYKEEFTEAYAEFDPDRAREKLDEIGLVDQNDDGWRQLPNGDEFQFEVEVVARETPKIPNVELVQEYWQEVGIDVSWRPISGELSGQRAPANLMDANLWHGDKATDILFPVQAQFFVPEPPGWEKTIWPEWGQWFLTDGEEGEEPPADIKELYGWYEEMLNTIDEDRRVELGHRILETQAENLWVIGTVGQSPWVVAADNNLRNLPEDVLWVWDTLWSTTHDPSQIYFEGGVSSSRE